MPPPFPSSRGRMTANPQRPKRYRPGKPIAEEPSSEEEDEEEEEIDEEEERRRERERQRREQRRAPPPKATSFPAGATSKITSGVQGVKLEEESEDEAGFVTEEEEAGEDMKVAGRGARAEGRQAGGSEEEESEEESSEGEEEEEEESSSDDEAPRRVLLRPTFIKKSQRKESSTPGVVAAADPTAEDEAESARRTEKADLLIRGQLEKEAAERAAGKKSWDDDENVEGENEEQIDDTDGLDPAAELAAWKLRELKRVKREREVIEQAEKEREEIERRRNLTAEEREREDREFISKQKEEREAERGKAGFMQRYFHKGAFFHEDLEAAGLDRRDLMGSRFMDEVKNREALPQYLQVRDVTKIGRKGRTKYRDLRAEDTGRWGVDGYNRSVASNNAARFGITDERFLPDQRDGDRDKPSGPTGANSSAIRDRPRQRQRSRSRSPSRSRPRPRSESRSRSRSRVRSRRRSPSRSRSRTRSPPRSPRRRDRYRDDDRHRRKRSPSPYQDRDKRRRVDSVA
ncbi:microfibrillar-associated protein 1 [Blastomyces parvus]|uniref:Microfibrillar-associated protein 1 n=1 Tax=Blastomyces parvus TaxID=2060905 RepID=A0A2B7X763_9EURO|nr:microfibrillar-associated protein 1 [Blastomyces parvus]